MQKKVMKVRDLGTWLAGGLIIVVLASIIAGLAVVGTPGKARAQKEDIAREAALAQTARVLNCYARGVGALPAEMSIIKTAINDSGSGIHTPAGCWQLEWKDDPITGEPFKIISADEKHVQICAVFALGDTELTWHNPSALTRNKIIIPDQTSRTSGGEHCYVVRLEAPEG